MAGGILFASTLGLATTTSLPFLLQPQYYVEFSISLTSIQLISNAASEWLRVAIIRNVGNGSSHTANESNIIAIYARVVLGLLAVGMLMIACSFVSTIPILVGVIFISAAIQAVFDGRSAWARAKFDNYRFVGATVLRALLMFFLVLILAYLSRSPLISLIGFPISHLISLFVFRDSASGFARSLATKPAHLRDIASLGGYAALGTNLSLGLSLFIRVFISSRLSAESAGVIFALDVSQRLFSTLGLALNTVFLQTFIRTLDSSSQANQSYAVRAFVLPNFMVLAIIMGACAFIVPLLGELVAPTLYRDAIKDLSHFVFVATGLFAVRQYAVDPVFVGLRKTHFIPIFPIFSIFSLALAHIATSFVSFNDAEVLSILSFVSCITLVISFFVLNKLISLGRRMMGIIFTFSLFVVAMLFLAQSAF